MSNFIKMPNMGGVSCYFDCRLNVSPDFWGNLIGTDNIELHNPTLSNEYVQVAGTNSSHGKLTHGGTSGGNATNSDYCTRYFIFRNASASFWNWKTIIGNETGTYYCSTIAMDSSGGLQFTRSELYFNNYKCTDWHVVAWRSNKLLGYTYVWVDGNYIGAAGRCYGWGADTYLSKGPSWESANSNTQYRAIIISDSNQTDEEVVENSLWLKNHYIDAYNPDLYVCRYLVQDGTALYTVADGELEEIHGTLSSTTFLEYGSDSMPQVSLLLELSDPQLLRWTSEAEEELPELTALVTATPPAPQICYSQNYDMTDPSIYGIENCEIVADSTTNFAFSFDGGNTWKTYLNGAWVSLAEEGSGMGAATVNAIPAEAWNEAAATQWMVRFALFEDGYVTSIVMHYINEED